ncbi:protein of unknown function [Nocardia cyriacigeorgica GUH-2]|uniref:Uncharacterized protein n=1 Tax=Nocardia cyriacigeorgica (strain GUH-2) TaxID=1127134 RepID=H6R9W3_NOCCG|nr:protein of unknown function [Nocardia cyriacigeorgica GUH-2]
MAKLRYDAGVWSANLGPETKVSDLAEKPNVLYEISKAPRENWAVERARHRPER